MTRKRIRQMFMATMGLLLLWAPFSHSAGREHSGGDAHFAPPPVHGPAPAPRGQARAAPVLAERGPRPEAARPRVEHEHWIGHEMGPQDRRFHLEHPFASGRYGGPIGHDHAYRLRGWDGPHHRFWVSGAFFGVAPWEVGYVADWDWASDDVVLYDDPDHPGWYLAYNVRLGTYVHIQYEGQR